MDFDKEKNKIWAKHEVEFGQPLIQPFRDVVEEIMGINGDDETILSIKEASIRTGIPVHSMCLSAHRRFPYGSEDEATRAKAEQIMRKAL